MSAVAARRERHDRWIVRFAGVLLRLLARTWRMRTINVEAAHALLARGQGLIYCAWHGEMLSTLWAYRHQGVVLLISEHRDGEILARVASGLGFGAVRGSSSRSADRALLALTREAGAGRAIAVTPDGPRGPRHEFAPGALIVAQRAGVPIVPVRAYVDRAWHLASWDAFEIPKPFARITVVAGDPVYVRAPGAREAAARTPEFAELMAQTRPPAND